MCGVVDVDRSFRRRARKKLHLEVEWRAVESLGNDRERRWKQQGAVVAQSIGSISSIAPGRASSSRKRATWASGSISHIDAERSVAIDRMSRRSPLRTSTFQPRSGRSPAQAPREQSPNIVAIAAA
jgi:hypothetical protein